jgi:hypothetical protein
MRDELTFWLAVGLVAIAFVAGFKVLASGPLGRVAAVRRLDEVMSMPASPARPVAA